MADRPYDLDTLLVYLGSRPEEVTGAVVPPIFQTSTFAQSAPGEFGLYDYTRSDNPTRTVLQECLAAAEGAKHALVFSSGMGAIDSAIGLLSAGDQVVAVKDIYGGTYRYLVDIASRRGVEHDFANLHVESELRKAMKPNTKMVWFESPTNPLLNLVDIEMVVGVAHEHGALAVMDNTFMSPYFQRPLGHGVDVVVHSMTKYLNGHSDVVMGCLMTRDDDLFERLKHLQNAVGAVPSPFDCFLATRGMKTLAVRMRRHAENAMAVARFLEGHPKVEQAIYPGLPSHPAHELAKRQASGFGGMVSFRVKSDLAGTKRFLCATKLFTLAVSLGGVESLIEHPATMTHFEVPQKAREAVGITDNLVRASIGIESPDDLIADLHQALARV